MEPQIKYIELKSGHAGNGPAWIGKVEFSKSGKTIYFNGHAFKGSGHGTCYDLETGEIYWISGVKKDGQDRHWSGNGKIMVDKQIVDEYLEIVELESLDPKSYQLVDVKKTNKRKFNYIENKIIDSTSDLSIHQKFDGLSINEIRNLVYELKRRESYTKTDDGWKFFTMRRLEAEKYLDEFLNNKIEE